MSRNAHVKSAVRATIRTVITASVVPAPYSGLYAYLAGRYADTVVLTFAEIEDLMGAPLPAPARARPEWWANDAEGKLQPHSQAWLHAHRTVTANLFAGTAVFVRVATAR